MKRYLEIAAQLRKEIEAGMRAGERLATETALSRRFAAGVNTIRQAFTILQQDGLVERRRGSGSYVKEPAPVTSKHVAVLSPLDISRPETSPFSHRAVYSMQRFLEDRGIEARVYIGRNQLFGEEADDCPEFVRAVEADRINGVISVLGFCGKRCADMLSAHSVPTVSDTSSSTYCVALDYHEMIRAGLRRLRGRGCERIASLAWGVNENVLQESYREAGIVYHPAWNPLVTHPGLPGQGWENFHRLWSANGDKPDGLLVCDEALLREAAMAAANLQIRIPEDLKLASHANRDSDIFMPYPVDCMVFDPEVYAALMAETMLTCLNGGIPARRQLALPYEWETYPVLEVAAS